MEPNRTPSAGERRRSQERLVRGAREGDARAWDELAAARLPGAWRLARAVLPDDESASAAVSNAFAAAWRELPRLEDVSRFDDWLDRILLSECRMRLGAAAAPPALPVDLMDRTRLAVIAAARPGRSTRRRSTARSVALAAGAALVLAVAVLGMGMGAARGWLPTLGGAPADPSATPGASAGGPAVASSPPPAGPAAPSGPLGTSLAPGSLGMVSLAGDRLRVRSLPSISDESRMLKPVLPAGTRVLVVDGPVEADGYTWYQVKTDGELAELADLFGWVATGKDGETWIAPTPPRCFGEPDAQSLTRMSRIDFLVCHGDAAVRVQARASDLWDERAGGRDCGWIRGRDGCDLDAGWLLLPSATIGVELEGGEHRDLVVALPPDLAEQLADLPRQPQLTLTVSLDSPESEQCRARDAASGDLILTPEHARTVCRLQFVIQQVEVQMTGEEPRTGLPSS